MSDMTEKEYDVLDDAITKTAPKLKSGVGGVFSKQRDLLDALDIVSANYIKSRAEATNKLPSQIIGEIVREKIAMSA